MSCSPLSDARLSEEVCRRPNRGCPRILKSRVLNASQNVYAPRLHFSILIAQALEWNFYLHLVSVGHESAFRFEYVVGIQVDRAFERIDVPESAASCRCSTCTAGECGAPRSILLNSKSIHAEQECDLTLILSVEENLYVVFARDVVAIRFRRANDIAVNLGRADSEVDRFG